MEGFFLGRCNPNAISDTDLACSIFSDLDHEIFELLQDHVLTIVRHDVFFGVGINFMISRADSLISPYLLSFQSSVQHISFVSVISWL